VTLQDGCCDWGEYGDVGAISHHHILKENLGTAGIGHLSVSLRASYLLASQIYNLGCQADMCGSNRLANVVPFVIYRSLDPSGFLYRPPQDPSAGVCLVKRKIKSSIPLRGELFTLHI